MSSKNFLYPLVVVDIALFSVGDDGLQVLMTKRSQEPEIGLWALPGGVLQPQVDKDLEGAATRVLRDKVGVESPYLREVRSFSGEDRDPRGWSIGMLYYALLPRDKVNAVVLQGIDEVRWVRVDDHALPLAFDHAAQLEAAKAALREKVERYALPLHLMPPKFSLSALQRTCEAILGRPLDKSVFRRRLKNSPDLEPLYIEFTSSAQRPSLLYKASEYFSF